VVCAGRCLWRGGAALLFMPEPITAQGRHRGMVSARLAVRVREGRAAARRREKRRQ